ncbi:MAG: TrmB family transcriptional regulator [Gemmatimonadales bacterium]
MTSAPDLTGFGFTPTESLLYGVLLRSGPGTGYAVARAAGLARANAYNALEGLVTKGAARAEEGRPKRYRPEPPATLIARIVNSQSQALDTLSALLDTISVPASPTLVELDSSRGVIRLLSHEIARAERRVGFIAPADAFPPLTPALRKAASNGVELELGSSRPVELGFGAVASVATPQGWPGELVAFVADDRGALLAGRSADTITGHWGTDPVFIASARQIIASVRGSR